jgi:hypothetical protein
VADSLKLEVAPLLVGGASARIALQSAPGQARLRGQAKAGAKLASGPSILRLRSERSRSPAGWRLQL